MSQLLNQLQRSRKVLQNIDVFSSKIITSIDHNIIFTNFTVEETAYIAQSHEHALNSLRLIKEIGSNFLKNNNDINKFYYKNYKDLFCQHDFKSLNKLYKKYMQVYEYLQKGIEYVGGHERCYNENNNIEAFIYTEPDDKKIYLCPNFFDLDVSPNIIARYYTQMGIIIHEASHLASGSEDNFYGIENCRINAKSCNMTFDNADCLAIFAEQNYYDFFELYYN